MSTVQYDPWALLCEAREVIAAVAESGNKDWELLQTIDAALVAHEVEGAVRWIDYGPYHAKSIRVDNFALTVTAHGINGPWHWEAPRSSGYEPTIDAAKAAAIRAAKGQRWGQK